MRTACRTPSASGFFSFSNRLVDLYGFLSSLFKTEVVAFFLRINSRAARRYIRLASSLRLHRHTLRDSRDIKSAVRQATHEQPR